MADPIGDIIRRRENRGQQPDPVEVTPSTIQEIIDRRETRTPVIESAPERGAQIVGDIPAQQPGFRPGFGALGEAFNRNILQPVQLFLDPFGEALATEFDRTTAKGNIIVAEQAISSDDPVRAMQGAELLPQFQADLRKLDATRTLEVDFLTGKGDLSGPELAGQLRSQFQERPALDQILFGAAADPTFLIPGRAAVKGAQAGVRGVRGAQETRRLQQFRNIPGPAQAVTRDIEQVFPGRNFTRQELIDAGDGVSRVQGGLLGSIKPGERSRIVAQSEDVYSKDIIRVRNALSRGDSDATLFDDRYVDFVLQAADLTSDDFNNLPKVLDALTEASERAASRSRAANIRADDEIANATADAIERGLAKTGRGTPSGAPGVTAPPRITRTPSEGFLRTGVPAEVPTPPVPPPTTSEKLIGFVDTAKPLREDVNELRRVEQGKRVAVGRELRESEPDPTLRRRRFLSALRGELPAPTDFDAPINQLSDLEHKELFETVQSHFSGRRGGQQLDFELSDTEGALEKVLNGQVPTPSELTKLEAVFGPEMTKALRKKRRLGRIVKEEALDLINLPRALKTAFDASAPLRQGLMLAAGHPINFFRSNIAMFKALAKESNAVAVTKQIREDENFGASQEAGLFLADRLGNTGNINAFEEAYMTKWASRIPGLKQSSRAYITFINKLRYDVWNDQYKRWVAQGFEGAELSQRSRQWADFVTKATGRGPLGPLENFAPMMNMAFFAPRLVSSRITLPLTLATHNKIRGLIAKDLAAAAASVGTVISMLNLTDAVDVEANPRSSDFGKIRVGPTRVDVMAGFQPLIRYATQIGTGQVKSTGTGRIRDLDARDRAQTFLRFMRSKLSPQAQIIVDSLTGTSFIGEETTAARLGLAAFEPLSEQDIREGYRENGLTGAIISATSLLGTSTVSYRTVNDAAEDNFGVGYQELWPYERNVARGLWQLTRATEPTGAFARLEELDLKQQQDLQDVAEGFLRNPDRSIRRRLNSRQRVNAYFDIVGTYATARRVTTLEAFGERQAGEEFTPNSEDPQKRALGQYFAALDTAKISEALFDSEGFSRELAMLERGWTQSQRLYVAANAHQTDIPPALLRILPRRTRQRIRQSQQARARQDAVRESNSP